MATLLERPEAPLPNLKTANISGYMVIPGTHVTDSKRTLSLNGNVLLPYKIMYTVSISSKNMRHGIIGDGRYMCPTDFFLNEHT